MFALRQSRRVCVCVCVGLSGLAAIVPLREATSQVRQRPLPQAAYQRLDSLEQVAFTGTTFAVRHDAVTTITSIGIYQGDCVRGPAPSAIRYPGLVSRLASIYRRSRDANLRYAIVGQMLWHAECAEAVEFLAAAAEEAPSAPTTLAGVVYDGSRATPQSGAVSLLVAFGPRGESVLRRMHSQGTVRDSIARASLENLSRNGFRWPKQRRSTDSGRVGGEVDGLPADAPPRIANVSPYRTPPLTRLQHMMMARPRTRYIVT